MDVSQLPQGIQDVISDSGSPRPPYNGPLASGPQDATAPDLGQPSATATIGDQLQSKGSPFLTTLMNGANAASAASPAPTAPGSLFRSLVAGAAHAIGNTGRDSRAVSGIMNAVSGAASDATHATDNLKPGESGALAGVMNTLAAGRARQQQEGKDSLEAQHKKGLIALTQVQTVAAQRAIQHGDYEDQVRHAAVGKTADDSLAKNHDLVAGGVNEDDLKQGLKSGKFDPKTQIYNQVGTRRVIGADGQEHDEPIFNVRLRKGLSVTPTPEFIEQAKRFGLNLSPDAPIDADQFDDITTRIQSNDATNALIHKAARNAGIDKDREQNEDQARKDNQLLTSPLGGYISAHHDVDAFDGLKALGKQVDPKSGQPTEVAKAAQRTLAQFDSKELDKHFDRQEKAREADLRAQELRERERDRRDAKGRTKLYDDAHKAWQQSLADNDFNPVAARESLRKGNPKMLAALADEETRSASVTESTDPLTGEARSTTKSKPTFFAVPGQQNQPTVGQLVNQNPAAADFQKSQDQSAQQSQQQQAQQQLTIDGREAESPTVVQQVGRNANRIANPNYNQAEKYIAEHPQLDPQGRAAVRKQFAQSQQPKSVPPSGVTIPAGYEWRANGPHGPGAYKVGS